MRKINVIELIGLGEIKLYTLKPKEIEFEAVSKEGLRLEKKQKEKGTRGTYVWLDDKGKEYNNSEVFYSVGKSKVQKVKKTDKVNFDIVEKIDFLGNFMSNSYYICDCNDTLLKRWDKEIGDKAITFPLHKSSVGLKFERAYVFKFMKHLILIAGRGNISEGIKEFETLKNSAKKSKMIKEVIEIPAEQLEKDIAQIIAV